MKIKKGVILNGISTNITKVLHVIEPILLQYGQELVITSGLDGRHMKKSKHYIGDAIDLRTWTLNTPRECVKDMKLALGDDYDIIFEINHIHLEYDKK